MKATFFKKGIFCFLSGLWTIEYEINMKIKLYPVKKIVLIIYLFFVIYLPPLLKNGMIDKVMLALSVFYIFVNLGNAIKMINIRENKRILLLCIILLAYSLIISLVNSIINGSGSYFDRPVEIIIFMIYFFCEAAAITVYCKKNKITSEEFLKLLVIVGLIQSIFVFASFFSSEIRSKLLGLISQNASYSRIKESISAGHYTALRRNYGFADTLYDRFGYICSILCAVSFNLGLYKKKWGYYTVSLIFVFCTLVNARSGVVLCVIAMIVSGTIFFIYNNGSAKTALRLVGLVFTVCVIIVVFLHILQQYAPDTYEWVESGLGSFFEVSDALADSSETDFYISSETWFFPDIFGFIFGTARDPHYTIGRSTDNGYVEQIWHIGIIGLLLSVNLFVGSIKRTSRTCTSQLEQSVLYTMIVLILVYMVKLFAFKNVAGTFIILSYCFLLNSLYATNPDRLFESN